MKLISCYIENFGGLSRYSLEFDEGVTVIQEPNGFGKTTLAEFLRAMFYGFPRKAKTLDKSKRQKYAPWNGGKFGGNLIFEFEGVRYRLERSFGATPRGDSFHLIDLTTNRKSERFSEEIGLELFQLDADSFERSTYMPQLRDNLNLTTAGIQAKLGDLVEDTNDLGNFDKALQTLKTSRSAFVPYRGSGGSVAEAASQVTRLQQELDGVQAQKRDLARCEEEIAELEAQRQQKEVRLETIRAQISAAAEAAVRREKRKQFAELQRQYDELSCQLNDLKARYPRGIPTAQELDAAQNGADALAVLAAQVITTPAERDAAAFLEAKGPRFENHLPPEAELEWAAACCESCAALTERKKNLGLSGAEQKQYESLGAVFETGVPDEEKLDALAERNRQLMKSRAALENLGVSEEDRRRMTELNRFFAYGVPTEQEIEAQTESLTRCRALERENALLTANLPAQKEKKTVLLIPGLVLAAAGIVLLSLKQFLIGGVILAVGILVALAGLLWKKENPDYGRISEKIHENEEQSRKLAAAVQAFTAPYVPAESPENALTEIRRSRESYLALAETLRQLKEKRSTLESAIATQEEFLRRELEPYFGRTADFDKAISHLRLARGQYLDLRQRAGDARQKSDRLQEEIDALVRELAAFLGRFYEELSPVQFGAAVIALRRDSEAYVRAKEQVRSREEREAIRTRQMQQKQAELDDFFRRFGLNPEPDARGQLQRLRLDCRAMADCTLREVRQRQQLERFRAESGQILTREETCEYNTEELKQLEKQLTAEILDLNRAVSQQEQVMGGIQNQMGKIPGIRDELEYWQGKRTADQKKARILDDTMAFLQGARDSLTTSYLGPIRESFDRYLEKLTRATGETVFISPDLDVQLERLGQARELGYFSAGQTDTVMLCMRFALVDALFSDVKPFVILDDPFVNLDDERTAEALELLRELAKDRQIVYLTCNSSRSL